VESDRDGAVMHTPEAGVYFGEGQGQLVEEVADLVGREDLPDFSHERG